MNETRVRPTGHIGPFVLERVGELPGEMQGLKLMGGSPSGIISDEIAVGLARLILSMLGQPASVTPSPEAGTRADEPTTLRAIHPDGGEAHFVDFTAAGVVEMWDDPDNEIGFRGPLMLEHFGGDDWRLRELTAEENEARTDRLMREHDERMARWEARA